MTEVMRWEIMGRTSAKHGGCLHCETSCRLQLRLSKSRRRSQ